MRPGSAESRTKFREVGEAPGSMSEGVRRLIRVGRRRFRNFLDALFGAPRKMGNSSNKSAETAPRARRLARYDNSEARKGSLGRVGARGKLAVIASASPLRHRPRLRGDLSSR